MNVGIVGCGLIGHKRAKALGNCLFIACADNNEEKAITLAKAYPNCKAYQNWQKLIADPHIDIVIIATPNYALGEIAKAAIIAGKHVLIEKPGAKSVEEIKQLIKLSSNSKSIIRIGFNHRYHRALQQAKSLVNQGLLGELMFIRGRYGHGGRLGYEKEWRADPALSGGGELLDQGVHLIDLARWFLGDLIQQYGSAHTYYWKMPVDDNAFLVLKNSKNNIAFLHVSCTEWKNLFSFEIYGTAGKLEINGLGGSYGTERITFYKMLPQMGPPETTTWEYPMMDDSWEREFADFLSDINHNRKSSVGLDNAYHVLKIVDDVYRMSEYDYCT
jgi:predicted dehydrogenase